MGDVFLLGAGFSKAVSDSMPLLAELSAELKKRVQLPEVLTALGDDVELWLTYLSQPHPWLAEPQNLRNKALFLEMSQHIGDVLTERTRNVLSSHPPDWLKRLIEYWHQHKSTVMTLNYDTIIERAARQVLQLINANHIYPVGLTDVRIREALYSGEDELETFKLFKLHGSVNWYYSGAASYFGETIYCSRVASWTEIQDDETRSMEYLGDKVPLIVPPTTEKVTYFQHETIRRTWGLAGQALRAASRLVCIGYSFPFTDLSMQFFLKDARAAGSIPLTIVNKASDIKARYKQLLGDAYPVEAQLDGDDALKKFVEQLTKPGGGQKKVQPDHSFT